jgi:hypothetical protein
METTLQSSCGPPRGHKRMLDAVQKIGPPPARSPLGTLARGEVELIVGGTKVSLAVERQERPRGGWQVYWRAPCCDRRCCALFVVANAPANAPAGSALTCRKCFPGGLTYRSQHTLHPALIRAAKLRRKLGAAPGLLSRLPPRPRHWRSDYWTRTVADLAAAEAVIADLLGATVRAAKRQKARLDGRR